MNLQEFSALKVGDAVEVPAFGNNRGVVSEVTDRGVRVAWEGGRSAVTFQYTVMSTSWMHWNKVEADTLDKALDDELAHPPASIMKP